MKWEDTKVAIIAALKGYGYTENPVTKGLFQKPDGLDGVMVATVDLRTEPNDGENILVKFINPKDLEAEPSTVEINGVLGATRQIMRRVMDGTNDDHPEHKPEPEQRPKPKQEQVKQPKPKSAPNVPATRDENNQVVDWRQGRSDNDIAREIEIAETEKFLKERGKSYPVSGKIRPDAHAIQHAANTAGVNTEIIKTEQNDKFCEVIVRAHLGNSYADGVVHHDFDVEKQLKTMEMINKNPHVLERWGDDGPVIKQGATIKSKTKDGFVDVDAMYYVVHALLQKKMFAIRDARTKAASIAQAMVLNREDWQDPEEVESEYRERKMVQNSMKDQKNRG